MILQIDELKRVYCNLRKDVDANFGKMYAHAVTMASAVGVDPQKPRVVARQKNRANNPSETVEQHFRANIAIPFLDHVVESLNTKFDRTLSYSILSK